MRVRVLVVNAGSSSLKLRVVDGDGTVSRSADAPAGDDAALRGFLGDAGDVGAAAHRVVHGGTRFRDAVVVDAVTRRELEETVELAPLHNPPALRALDAVTALLPDVAAVACFDTAFHATLPPEASTYAIPARWRDLGVRRYGFHGFAHAWAARRALELDGRRPLRHVSCHLGSGASLCAVLDGRSVDTTMGFTPLEGLVMSTRSGTVDPGALLWLLGRGETREGVERTLEHGSGVLALAGDADMRAVEAAAERGDAASRLAFDVYAHRAAAGIAAMATSLGGLDVLTFSGGVGEHSEAIRAAICARTRWLVPPSGPAVHVVPAREELEIATAARRALTGAR